MNTVKPCPECGQRNLYSTVTSSGPVLLRGLGGSLRFPKFEIVVCSDCGLTRFFASEAARNKLTTAGNWKKK